MNNLQATDQWMLGKEREWREQGRLRADGSLKLPDHIRRHRGRPRKPLSANECRVVLLMRENKNALRVKPGFKRKYADRGQA